jgi:hypothetical protein
MPFVMLSSFCLTFFTQYAKVWLKHAIVGSISNKDQDPFSVDYGLNSPVLFKMEV